jgi:glycine oxidase
VLDRGAIAREASWAAGGILAPQAETAVDSPLLPLALAARRTHQRLAEELAAQTGITVDYHRFGVLRLAFNETELLALDSLVTSQRAMGLNAEILSPEALRRIEPATSPAAVGAALFPDDHRVDNRRLVEALMLSAAGLGVEIQEYTTVLGLETHAGRVTGIKTTAGRIEAGSCVNAMGAWASQLEGDPSPLPVRPVKGHMVALTGTPSMSHVVYGGHGYVVPRRDGRLIAGSTMEESGFDTRVQARGITTVLSQAMEIVPAAAGASVSETWTGLRPATPDGLPVIGKSAAIEGLFILAGLFRNGILLGPLSGELVASMALGNGAPTPTAAALDLVPFRPGRFD